MGPGDASGYAAYQFRSSVTIHVLQHPVNMGNDTGVPANDTMKMTRNDPVAASFRAYNAWISSLAYSDLNAGDNAIMVEQMTLVHEGLDMYWEKTMGTQVRRRESQLGR